MAWRPLAVVVLSWCLLASTCALADEHAWTSWPKNLTVIDELVKSHPCLGAMATHSPLSMRAQEQWQDVDAVYASAKEPFGRGLMVGPSVCGCRVEKAANTHAQARFAEYTALGESAALRGTSLLVMNVRNPYIRSYDSFLDKAWKVCEPSRPDCTRNFLVFLKVLVQKGTYKRNVHFMPAVEICRPDKVHFDFLFEVEQLDDQEHCFMAALWPDAAFKASHTPPPRQVQVKHSDERIVADRVLNPDTVAIINDLYRADFEYFGYRMFDPQNLPADITYNLFFRQNKPAAHADINRSHQDLVHLEARVHAELNH